MLQTANRLYITQTKKVFYCSIKIKIPASFDECILEDGFALLENIDRLYNSYQPESYFSKINQNAGNWVEVDHTTIDLLQTLISVGEITNGAYDITAMPLIQLWGFYKNTPSTIPSASKIETTLKNVDYRQIVIAGNNVKIDEGQEIITGSFIKAFAVDMLVKQLKSNGVSDAIINAGGSTIYAINNNEHSNWNINIPDPYNKEEKLARIALSNTCFSLSAKAHNYITINGKEYGHIINALTGYPSANIQSGIKCTSAFLSDVLSTALFAVNENEYIKVIQQLQQKFEFQSYLIGESGVIKDIRFNLLMM